MSERHVHRFKVVETRRFLRPTKIERRCECGTTPDEHIAELERQMAAAQQRVLETTQRHVEVLAEASRRIAEVRATVEGSAQSTNSSEAP